MLHDNTWYICHIGSANNEANLTICDNMSATPAMQSKTSVPPLYGALGACAKNVLLHLVDGGLGLSLAVDNIFPGSSRSRLGGLLFVARITGTYSTLSSPFRITAYLGYSTEAHMAGSPVEPYTGLVHYGATKACLYSAGVPTHRFLQRSPSSVQ